MKETNKNPMQNLFQINHKKLKCGSKQSKAISLLKALEKKLYYALTDFNLYCI